jgi:Bacterial PH domain
MAAVGPAASSRYLLPYEATVITTRPHSAVLLIPAAEGFGGLAIALIAGGALISDFTVRVVVWTGGAFLFFQMLSAIASWSTHLFVVTSQRVLEIRGFGSRIVETTPLTDLTGIALGRSAAGRMLGYGTFYLSSGNRRQVLMNYVPYPEQLYLEICGMIFGDVDSGGASGPDLSDD